MINFCGSLNHLFSIYLRTGGFPSIINSNMKADRFYERFVEIVTKDSLKQGRSDRTMEEVISGIIKRYGSRYELRRLAEEAGGASQPTVMEYLRLLEKSGLAWVLYSYDLTRHARRYKGCKKVYLIEPFIFHAFNSWIYGRSRAQEVLLGKKVSPIVEGIVGSHLARIKEIPVIVPPDRFLWFYYSVRSGKEMDFLYRRENGSYLGIEVKYQTKAMKIISPIDEYLLLSRDEFEVTDGNKAKVTIPVPVFLSLLGGSEKNL